jgi:hypothetical protein
MAVKNRFSPNSVLLREPSPQPVGLFPRELQLSEMTTSALWNALYLISGFNANFVGDDCDGFSLRNSRSNGAIALAYKDIPVYVQNDHQSVCAAFQFQSSRAFFSFTVTQNGILQFQTHFHSHTDEIAASYAGTTSIPVSISLSLC